MHIFKGPINKGLNKRVLLETILAFTSSAIIFKISGHYDWFESFSAYAQRHEVYNLDESVIMLIYLGAFVASLTIKRYLELTRRNHELQLHQIKLQNALHEIKALKGMIPICANSKQIRDDDGYWHQVETYIKAHSNAEFTHGYCPECITKLFPELEDDFGTSET